MADSVSEPAYAVLQEQILDTFSQLRDQKYHFSYLKPARWEYLHHENWQMLQIGAFSPT